jgi:uncharacterized protein YndB with AHSA1/START domain
MTATAQASRMIPANPADVWETLTSRKGMKAYMMGADVETDWRVGGPITMQGEFNGKRFEDKGEVRSFEPERWLSYTHTSSASPDSTNLVIFKLTPRDGGTEVQVTQENLDDRGQAPDEKQRAQYVKTWTTMLKGLEKAVAN